MESKAVKARRCGEEECVVSVYFLEKIILV